MSNNIIDKIKFIDFTCPDYLLPFKHSVYEGWRKGNHVNLGLGAHYYSNQAQELINLMWNTAPSSLIRDLRLLMILYKVIKDGEKLEDWLIKGSNGELISPNQNYIVRDKDFKAIAPTYVLLIPRSDWFKEREIRFYELRTPLKTS